ncbi:MAG TPA: hypothetical protein VFA80_18100 [Xanthobacteraceae bacterium]|nr:hypothetical protein [Xanthobacteraceae bacterium]
MGESAVGLLPLGGDVIAAGTVLAGLILVYLGAVATEYASFQKTEQGAVRPVFMRRAWFAVLGIVFSIAAAGLAVLGKWLALSCVVGTAAILLALALVWSVVIALLLAAEIK